MLLDTGLAGLLGHGNKDTPAPYVPPDIAAGPSKTIDVPTAVVVPKNKTVRLCRTPGRTSWRVLMASGSWAAFGHVMSLVVTAMCMHAQLFSCSVLEVGWRRQVERSRIVHGRLAGAALCCGIIDNACMHAG